MPSDKNSNSEQHSQSKAKVKAPRKSPSFRWYPREWLGDQNVALMGHVERSVHFHWINMSWQETPIASIPDDDVLLEKWCAGIPDWYKFKEDFSQIKANVTRAWVFKNGRWHQRGLLKQVRSQAEWVKKSQRGGQVSAAKRAAAKQKIVPTSPQKSVPKERAAPLAANLNNQRFPEAMGMMREFFPTADDLIGLKVFSLVTAKVADITDPEMVEVIRRTHKRTQESPALWTYTAPEAATAIVANIRGKVSRGLPLDLCPSCSGTKQVVNPVYNDEQNWMDKVLELPKSEQTIPCPDCTKPKAKKISQQQSLNQQKESAAS